MTFLILASFAVLLTHLGVSSTPLRGVIADSVGEQGYLGIFSLTAAVTLGFLIYAYINIPHAHFVWMPGMTARAFAKVLMPFAFIFLVSGLMVRNPTSVGQDAAVTAETGAILKITRHPMQWGILLWAILHLVANGDRASIVFFGTFALLSSLGMLAMDAKRKKLADENWKNFFATTSYFPFMALLQGRAQLRIMELNWLAVGIGAVLYVLVFIFHGWVAGVALF